MLLPPYGLCLPCRFRRCVGAGVVMVTPKVDPSSMWAIRLAGIVLPNPHSEPGLRAQHFIESVLEEAETLSVWIPADQFPPSLAQLACDQVAGDIFIGTEDRLSDMLCRAGHADRADH